MTDADFEVDVCDLRAGGNWPDAWADLWVCDPPQGRDVQYPGVSDRLTHPELRDLFETLAKDAVRSLCEGGTAVLLCDDAWQAEARCVMEGAGLGHRQTVIWHYRFGQARDDRFTPSHSYLHVFHRPTEKPRFQPSLIRVPSERQKAGDRRAKPAGKVPESVWEIPRVAGTHAERVGYPTQLPLDLCRRVVMAYTPSGCNVANPCCAPGGFGVAAVTHGCSYRGIDLSRAGVELARERIKAAVPG